MPLDNKGKRRSPNFAALEKLIDLDDYRELVFSAHGLAHTDSGGVTAISLLAPGQYVFGPVDEFVSTVARPALMSASRCIAETHLGFEDQINEFQQLLDLLASGAAELASRGINAFPLDFNPSTSFARPPGN
jgi:hypothetical protein